jgi:hypothetical protein
VIGPGRGLQGQRVGISVAADDARLARRGFTMAGMNRFTVRIARALLADGARLAFGHDWRPEGVMEAIASVAFDYGSTRTAAGEPPVILNLLPWPNERSETDPSLLTRLERIVEVRPVGLPQDLPQVTGDFPRGTPEWRYRRARGLTLMRRELTRLCSARIAFGGKFEAFDGRLPGIVEEVFLALYAEQTVYLAGLLGGAAEAMGRVLLEGGDPSALWRHVQLEELYRQHQGPSAPGLDDSALDLEALSAYLASGDARERLLNNGLSESENRRLLHSSLEEEVLALTIRGLRKVAERAPRAALEGPRPPGA